MKLAWPSLRRPTRSELLFGAFALAAFLLSLRWTFPSETVRERLIFEAGARGWQIDIKDVGPSGLLGARLDGVVLTDRSGLPIPVDRARASLRILPLLVGKAVLDCRATLYDGTIQSRADLTGENRRYVVELDGLDLSRALPIRKAADTDLSGKVSGRIEVLVPGGALEKSHGTFDLEIEQLRLKGGRVPLPVGVGTLTAAARIEQGRVAVDKLEAKGGDVELRGEGIAAVLQQRMQYAPLTGQVRLRLQPALWQKPDAAPFQSLLENQLAASRNPDGSYQFQVSGNLGNPQVLPASPGGGGQRQQGQ